MTARPIIARGVKGVRDSEDTRKGYSRGYDYGKHRSAAWITGMLEGLRVGAAYRKRKSSPGSGAGSEHD